jgi:AAA15 family ATPase/GTPase
MEENRSVKTVEKFFQGGFFKSLKIENLNTSTVFKEKNVEGGADNNGKEISNLNIKKKFKNNSETGPKNKRNKPKKSYFQRSTTANSKTRKKLTEISRTSSRREMNGSTRTGNRF